MRNKSAQIITVYTLCDIMQASLVTPSSPIGGRRTWEGCQHLWLVLSQQEDEQAFAKSFACKIRLQCEMSTLCRREMCSLLCVGNIGESKRNHSGSIS